MRTILIVSLSVMSGCSEKDTTPPNDTSLLDTNPADPEDTSDEVGQQDTAPPESHAPKIQTCDAYCEWHDVGDTYWKWTLGCNVTDPEGLENIWNGTTAIAKNGTPVADYLVACNTSGICTTGFREETDNILCSQANSYNFTVKITDWDGNESKPYLVTGRQK